MQNLMSYLRGVASVVSVNIYKYLKVEYGTKWCSQYTLDCERNRLNQLAARRNMEELFKMMFSDGDMCKR